MSIRSNISREDLFKNYKFETLVPPETHRFTVKIFDERYVSSKYVGSVEKKFSKWHVVGNDEREISDLYDAIKKVVDEYLTSKNEFTEL